MDYLNVIISSSVVSLLLVISGYFINLWIAAVDDSIKDTNLSLKELKKQLVKLETDMGIIRSLQEKQSKDTEILSSKVQSKLLQSQDELDAIKREVRNHQDALIGYGKVIRKYFGTLKKD